MGIFSNHSSINALVWMFIIGVFVLLLAIFAPHFLLRWNESEYHDQAIEISAFCKSNGMDFREIVTNEGWYESPNHEFFCIEENGSLKPIDYAKLDKQYKYQEVKP